MGTMSGVIAPYVVGVLTTNVCLSVYAFVFFNNNNNNKLHLYLTSAIFQSINSELKSSLSIEVLGGGRLSSSQ